MKCATLLGLFPHQFLFKKHYYLQQGYSIFSKITFVVFTLILLSTYMQLLVIVCAKEIDVTELSKNLIITPLFTITIIRQSIMYKSGFKRLLEHILEREQWMNRYANDNQLNFIEERSANELNRNIKIYLGMMIITELSYTIRPLLDPATETLIYNNTVLVKSLPLSIWLPFNKVDHFIAAYVCHIIYTIFGSSYDTFGEFVLISVLVYPTTQLKGLKHVLKNMEFYQEKILQHYTHISKEDAAIVVLRQSIQQHKIIVQYVSDFNELMGTCLFLDFIQSSLHMACVLAEVLTEDVTSMQLVSVIAYLVILNFRLFLYYYYANELTVLNQELAVAIYQSKWYQYSKKVGFMTFMIIMRNQKGLKYKLGLFGYMSLNKFISILNAAYSYVMLMYSVK
uniref:Odorant receptor n=2 Tax=Dendroctonus ponderosae TaxID=77166 RepID=A0AAR5PYV0_DENPD